MIVKTGANYQAEGGYIEASIDDGVISIVKNDKVISFHDTDSIVTGFVPISITNSTNVQLFPGVLSKDGGIDYIGSALSAIPVGGTMIVKVPREIAFRLGFSSTVMVSSTPDVEILRSGNQYFAKVVNYPADGLSVTLTN